MELDFQPEMVGRQQELEVLQAYLDEASNGKGRAVFVSGEAGVGKSRLVNELIDIAKSQGFQTLLGYSLGESLTPYMPFLDALRSGNLESLFAEEAPRVEAVYLVTHSGLLIKDVMRKETELSPDIFASMLSTVSDFVSESLSKFSGEEKEGLLNSLGYEKYQILIETGRLVSLAVILTGQKNEFLIDDMRAILFEVAKRYGGVLENWDGDDQKLKGLENILEPLIASGKYDGVYYGRDNPRARRNLLFENVSLGLIRNSEKTPTLLCIEDLHWADPSSMALMHYIARNTRDTGMLMLGTYRPEDIAVADGKGHPLTDAMQLMDREDLLEMVELSRLPGDRMEEFLDALLGDNDLDYEFREVVYKETEGNPLFIIQLVRFLVEEGIIIDDNRIKRLTKSLKEVDVPTKTFNVIARRLGRLDKEERRTVDMASVIGGVFTSDILADSLGVDKVQLLENLRTLEQTHTLIHSQNGSYRFDHAKLREVLYDEIPAELRAEHHRIVAQSIEKLNQDDLDEVVGDLAFHYSQSGRKEKAILYLIQAAEKAKKEYSNEEAMRFYSEALEFEEDKKKRIDILVAVGFMYAFTGEYDRSMESCEEALEYATEDTTRAEILAMIGGIHWRRGEYADSLRICTEAENLVKDEECMEEAQVLSMMGLVHNHLGEYDKALEFHQRCLEIVEKMGDQQRGVAGSLGNVGLVYLSLGEYGKALEFFGRSLGMSESIGDQENTAYGLNNIGAIHELRGEHDKALEFHERSLRMKEKMGDLGGIAGSLGNIGFVHYRRGAYDKALEFHNRGLNIFGKIGGNEGIAECLKDIGIVHFRRGEHDKALEFYLKSQGIYEKIGNQKGSSMCLNNIGALYEHTGEYDKASENYSKSLETAENLGSKDVIVEACIGMSKVYSGKNDFKRALEFGNQAYGLSSELDQKDTLAISECVLGTIYREEKEWKESIENFERSIEILENIGLKYELAESYFEFGIMWREKGDGTKAEACLKKSQDIYEDLELDKEGAKAREALDTLRR